MNTAGKTLHRSRDVRMLGGVCGGVAAYLGVDPTLVRLVWVALSFVGGSAIVAYLVMWAVVPEEPEARDQVVEQAPPPGGGP